MKKQLFGIAFSLVVVGLTTINAKEPHGTKPALRTAGYDANSSPTISVLNINNLAYWIDKSGAGTYDGSPNGTQADYPIFTGGLIYKDGVVFGTKSDEYTDEAPIRVGGSTYYKGMKAGFVRYDADGNVVGADNPDNHHVWRVRTDYMTADLSKDAANFYSTTSDAVTSEQIQNVRDQYEYDWMNWPAGWGAPFDDVNGNGVYDSDTDIPGYPGANQTIWVVANDVPTIVDENGVVDGPVNNTAPNLYGSDPIGMEMRITLWGYAYGAGDPLGNVIFRKVELKYTGLETGSTYTNPAVLDTVYFTQWSDPDLGTFTDDYVGSDVDLSFGYVYNGNRLDNVFNGIYGLPCPAGGHDFLQGPADNLDIDGDGDMQEYLPMTSFTYFGAGGSIDDPTLSDYSDGSLTFYNLMEGYLPRPAYPQQVPWTDLSTGESTDFVLSGDPVSGSGWIDGVQLPPGDRRMVMTSGPFKMSKGESVTTVLATVGGTGLDAVSSVSVAKYHDTFAQYAYDKNFSLPSAPSTPSVDYVEMDGKIALDWGFDEAAVNSTELLTSEGFAFEGYNVYQLPRAGSPLTEAVKVATFDKVNLIQNILDPAVDPLTGLVIDAVKQTGTDIGVQRYYSTDYDEIRGRPMSNGATYHFAVTAYSYLADNDGSPFKTLESSEARVSVAPHAESPGVDINNYVGSDIDVVHNGTANASVTVNIINSNKLVNDEYTVYFDQQLYYRDMSGNWVTDDPASAGKVLDVGGSTVSGIAETAEAGTINLFMAVDIVSPDYNYADGVLITLPEETIINSAVTSDGALEGMISGNEIMFGDMSVSTAGFFAGGEILIVNIGFPSDFPNTPIPFDYTIYDDGWAQAFCIENCETCEAYNIGENCAGDTTYTTIVNAEGTSEITTLAFATKIESHWNLKNSSDTDLLIDQTYIGGSDLYGGMSVDNYSQLQYNYNAAVNVLGFQVNVNGSYDAPLDVYEIETVAGPADIDEVGEAVWDIDSYKVSGWEPTAKATDTYGSGIESVDTLQRDIQVRFTGEFESTPTTTASGVVYYPALSEGGSYCWIYGSRLSDLSDHPDPSNPGDGSPFRIKIPFEVWDMEAEGGPKQIDIIIYDREQTYNSGDTVYAFNPYARMYTEFIHIPYEENGEYGTVWADAGNGFSTIENSLTWNVVWWQTQFNQGDVVTFKYANPIQIGVDEFTFSTSKNSVNSSNDLSNVSVYPNPYYGLHEMEMARNDKYVSLNNLPMEATVKIYSLGGTFVREIDKNDESQFVKWDLKNQYGYPVASGLYIIRINSGDQEKILKLALVQETQVLKYY
tara:strand:- start:1657 stop:5568 length:3912 start_codon:yes stop_codon:yes gene_type:complete